MFFDVLVVLFSYLKVYLIVWVNFYFRIPFKIRILGPEKWNWPTKLNVRKNIFFSTVLCEENDFGFCSVGCIAVEVASSRYPSFSLSSLISSRHQRYLTSIIYTSMCKVDDDKAWYESSNPLIGLYFNEIINPIAVVHVAASFIFHWTVGVDKGLEWVG